VVLMQELLHNVRVFELSQAEAVLDVAVGRDTPLLLGKVLKPLVPHILLRHPVLMPLSDVELLLDGRNPNLVVHVQLRLGRIRERIPLPCLVIVGEPLGCVHLVLVHDVLHFLALRLPFLVLGAHLRGRRADIVGCIGMPHIDAVSHE